MTLDQCRKIAIGKQRPGKPQVMFDLIGKDSVINCQWLDPENGVFSLFGVPGGGFIDMRDSKEFLKKFKWCEIIQRGEKA